MMEMQQRHSRPQNVYDVPKEQAKTEDVYQSLQTPPTVAATKASRKGEKIMVLLLIVNILLLTTILMVTGTHYYQFRQGWADILNDQKTNQDCHSGQSGVEMMSNQKSNQEIWYLHAEMFYLFWSNQGDCRTAERFCAKRMANLATVTKSNMDWLQLQINGKRMLVKTSQLHSSGDGLESPLLMDDDDDEDDESDCGLFSVTSDLSEQVEGWVCERAAQRLNYRPTMV